MAAIHKLSESKIRFIKSGATLSDGGGLYITKRGSSPASWSFRKMIKGERIIRGLGSFPDVSVKDARAAAAQLREDIESGEFRKEEDTLVVEFVGMPTFSQYAKVYLSRHVATLAEPTQRLWRQTIEDYAKPLRDLKLDEITIQIIANRVLMPIWQQKPETAKRLQTRLWRILAVAQVEGYIKTNPAEWRGGLDILMPAQARKIKHHKSMNYDQMPAFYAWLDEKATLSARCWQILILTGLRQSEGRFAQWSEIDFEAGVWTVPAERMKISANGDHRIPIAPELERVLRAIGRRTGNSKFVFQSRHGGCQTGVISETSLRKVIATSPFAGQTVMHGLRTSLRIWLNDKAGISFEACEAALHHVQKSTTVRAYLRTDFFEERQRGMLKWSNFVRREVAAA